MSAWLNCTRSSFHQRYVVSLLLLIVLPLPIHIALCCHSSILFSVRDIYSNARCPHVLFSVGNIFSVDHHPTSFPSGESPVVCLITVHFKVLTIIAPQGPTGLNFDFSLLLTPFDHVWAPGWLHELKIDDTFTRPKHPAQVG